jgi:hypothetical protein
MSQKEDLYTQIVKVSEEFLGPAGERFVSRQIETHLSIQPQAIQPKHLPELVEWIRLTFTMITNDSKMVNDFANGVLHLTSNQHSKSVSNSR